MSATNEFKDAAIGENDERIEALRRVTAAAMRAIAHKPELQLIFSANGAGLSGCLVHLPLPSADGNESLAVVRGEADAISLRLRFHDRALHRKWTPTCAMARPVFDALEQARCEALGARRMQGVARNLSAATEERCRRRSAAETTTPQTMSMAEVVGLFAREKFTGRALPGLAGRMVDPVRSWIESRALDGFAQLVNVLGDQDAFAARARRLAGDLVRGERVSIEHAQCDDHTGSGRPESNRQSDGDDDEGLPYGVNRGVDRPGAGDTGDDVEPDVDARAGMRAHVHARGHRHELDGRRPDPEASRYRVFTTEFDEVVKPASLCTAAELAQLRLELDAQLGPFQSTVARLAKRLQRRVLAQQMRTWEFDVEEGTLDTARLSRVVIEPLHSLVHRRERESAFGDAVVQLLIDNSGSMRGRHIAIAAMSADIIARTLCRCGVKVEILGFTTRAWKGGTSRERWLAAGRPPAPGRLNDLRHIIYKSADTPWRRARVGLGLMLRDGLLKENIDGEALLWAHARLLSRVERRKILMVISDGLPVDDSTLQANHGNCLEQHLCDVIEVIEQRSPVELVAIGIGHDVSHFYRRALTLVDAGQLGGAMLERLVDLFHVNAVRAAKKLRRRRLTTRA